MPQQICDDIKQIETLKFAKQYECEECVKHNGHWLHLRTCQTCGTTLCCDSSPAQHMSKHNHATGHAVVISAEPGEKWLWCYKDELMVEYE